MPKLKDAETIIFRDLPIPVPAGKHCTDVSDFQSVASQCVGEIDALQLVSDVANDIPNTVIDTAKGT